MVRRFVSRVDQVTLGLLSLFEVLVVGGEGDRGGEGGGGGGKSPWAGEFDSTLRGPFKRESLWGEAVMVGWLLGGKKWAREEEEEEEGNT